MMVVSRLLNSWAMPPASRPTASSFCDCISRSSSRWRWPMSVTTPSAPMKSPCSSCSGLDETRVQTERPLRWRKRSGCTSESPWRCRSSMAVGLRPHLLVHEVARRAAEHALHGLAEHGRHLGVDEGGAPLGVEQPDAIAGPLHDAPVGLRVRPHPGRSWSRRTGRAARADADEVERSFLIGQRRIASSQLRDTSFPPAREPRRAPRSGAPSDRRGRVQNADQPRPVSGGQQGRELLPDQLIGGRPDQRAQGWRCVDDRASSIHDGHRIGEIVQHLKWAR